jgi:two-component system nitrogen regulation response regulator GlnG
MDGTVLVADDDRTIRTVLTQALTRAGCKVHATSSLMTLMRWVEEGKGDLVISDVIMPDGNGLDALPRISRMRPGLPVIVISAQNTIMTAIQAAEAEAFDYLPKPFDLPDLMKRSPPARWTRSVARRQGAVRGPRNARGGRGPAAGRAHAGDAGAVPAGGAGDEHRPAVLITGESGTGKSLLARAIHDFSDRRTQPFIVAQAGGAAGRRRSGRADRPGRGGSILFDEVADYDPDSQARVVRLLDMLGDKAPRVMATTQADLTQADGGGPLPPGSVLPAGRRQPACARPARAGRGHPASGRSFPCPRRARVRHHPPPVAGSARGHPRPSLARQRAATGKHHSPAVGRRRADPEIGKAEVAAVLGQRSAAEPLAGPIDNEKLSASVARHLKRYFDLHGGQLPPAGVYQRILKEVETPLIEIALDATAGNQARCADLLGINRNTLRKKITDLDIRVTRRRKLM